MISRVAAPVVAPRTVAPRLLHSAAPRLARWSLLSVPAPPASPLLRAAPRPSLAAALPPTGVHARGFAAAGKGKGPGAKTSNALRKRFRVTAKGDVVHRRCAGNNHKASSQNRKQKNRIRAGATLHEGQAGPIRQVLGKSQKA